MSALARRAGRAGARGPGGDAAARPGEAQSALLAATLLRFSPLALGCVIALVDRRRDPGDRLRRAALATWSTPRFGRAVLIKARLLIGPDRARGRQPPAPRPGAARASRTAASRPGGPAALCGAALRAEVAPDRRRARRHRRAGQLRAARARPARARSRGRSSSAPARLEYTVDPAEVGPQRDAPLPLRRRDRGAVHRAPGSCDVDLALPDEDIGPIEAELRRAGPGPLRRPGSARSASRATGSAEVSCASRGSSRTRRASRSRSNDRARQATTTRRST